MYVVECVLRGYVFIKIFDMRKFLFNFYLYYILSFLIFNGVWILYFNYLSIWK